MSTRKCEGCDGRGVRAPAQPSCRIDGAKRPWIVVERCDTCKQFKDDLEAGLSLFEVVGWFECRNGSFHALANATTRRARQRRALVGSERHIGGGCLPPDKAQWPNREFVQRANKLRMVG